MCHMSCVACHLSFLSQKTTVTAIDPPPGKSPNMHSIHLFVESPPPKKKYIYTQNAKKILNCSTDIAADAVKME